MRDFSGNACGLFYKLHGVVRPLSLKTDVIKKRNRGGGGGAAEKAKPTPPKSSGQYPNTSSSARRTASGSTQHATNQYAGFATPPGHLDPKRQRNL